MIVLGQETDALGAEPFVLFITLDTQLMPSIFVARSRTGLLLSFPANDAFRIMEITFNPGHFLIFFQFRHLLST